ASFPLATARWSGVNQVPGILASMSFPAPALMRAVTTSSLPPSAAACSRVLPPQPRLPVLPSAPAFNNFSTKSWLAVRAAYSRGFLSHSAHCFGVARSHISLKIMSAASRRILARSSASSLDGMLTLINGCNTEVNTTTNTRLMVRKAFGASGLR
ncbi:unnamed protein product, partial [Ectocarpus fasciculatus]